MSGFGDKQATIACGCVLTTWRMEQSRQSGSLAEVSCKMQAIATRAAIRSTLWDDGV